MTHEGAPEASGLRAVQGDTTRRPGLERQHVRAYSSIGGQSTNCKINNRVLLSCRGGQTVKVWFHQTYDYNSRELFLRAAIRPEWNYL
jgi:hypothetical protein